MPNPLKRKKTIDKESENLPTTERKKTQPIVIKNQDDLDKNLFIFRCTNKGCGNAHFRHGGYMETVVPFMQADKEGLISNNSAHIMICTKCRSCFTFINNKWFDVTKVIDIKAWEKLEKELHKATGPGGQC